MFTALAAVQLSVCSALLLKGPPTRHTRYTYTGLIASAELCRIGAIVFSAVFSENTVAINCLLLLLDTSSILTLVPLYNYDSILYDHLVPFY